MNCCSFNWLPVRVSTLNVLQTRLIPIRLNDYMPLSASCK